LIRQAKSTVGNSFHPQKERSFRWTCNWWGFWTCCCG